MYVYTNVYMYVYTNIYMYVYRYNTRCITACSRIGWLRLVGSLKLQVSFAEYSLFCTAFLQKRPIILRSLLIVATLHEYSHTLHTCAQLD